MKRNIAVRLVILSIGIGVVGAVFFCYREQCVQHNLFTPRAIKEYILGFGSWSLAVYVLLYAVNTISLIPPIGVMSLAAGFIFGPALGSIGIMTGSFIGTTATFFISRFFGRGLVNRMTKGRFKNFEDKLNRNGFVTILFIRLVPVIPWEVVNYAAGLSRIKYRDFISATLVGIFPSVIIQTFFADRIANFSLKDPKLIAAIAAFLLLIFVPTIYMMAKKRRRR